MLQRSPGYIHLKIHRVVKGMTYEVLRFILCFWGRGSEAANTGHFSVEDLMEAKIAQLAPNPWLTRQVKCLDKKNKDKNCAFLVEGGLR
jgi:hypothetical protein